MPETESHRQLRSPDELFKAAKTFMLDGREPRDEHDWFQVVNFWAANIAKGVEEQALKLMVMIYKVPISEENVRAIAKFQRDRKESV